MKNMTKIINMGAITAFALINLAGCGSGNSTNGESGIGITSYKTAGWYGKTQVSATASDGKVYNHATAGVFGELVQSDDAKDQHDILGYGSAILQVVFPQTEWAEDNGDYFSNYQYFNEDSTEKRVWTFQIKNQHTVNLSNAPITIDLDGIYDVSYIEKDGAVDYKESEDINQIILNTLNLVDVDNSVSYTLAELKIANLTMDGLHTRTFRWVLGEVDSSDYEPLEVIATKTASIQQAKAVAVEPGVKSKFGLPPQ